MANSERARAQPQVGSEGNRVLSNGPDKKERTKTQ